VYLFNLVASADPGVEVLETALWGDSDVARIGTELRRLGLMHNVAELELYGLTVVDPTVTEATELAERAHRALLEVHRVRNGTVADEETGASHADVFFPTLYKFFHMDPVFTALMTHPVAMALVTYVLGGSFVYSATAGIIKGPASTLEAVSTDDTLTRPTPGLQLGLHVDTVVAPDPLPHYATYCNTTWLLSDYTLAGGCLCFVPGSHRQLRRPLPGEGADRVVAVEAPRGSLVVWGSNLWHGAFPRTIPGLRTNVAFQFVRSHVAPLEDIDDITTPEFLAGRSEEFRRLMRQGLMTGFDEHGPLPVKMARMDPRPTHWS
jgi:ectoine hydroxylase-related dioxygenase (phytanoyl-CoA dioxygenase family)